MCGAERVQVAVAQKERAGSDSPEESRRREQRIGQVCHGKQNCSSQDRSTRAREKSAQTKQDEVLQDELLHKRPDDVTGGVTWILPIAEWYLQCTDVGCEHSGSSSQNDRSGNDPPALLQAGDA